MNYWVVSNNSEGSCANDDWDMKQILEINRIISQRRKGIDLRLPLAM